ESGRPAPAALAGAASAPPSGRAPRTGTPPRGDCRTSAGPRLGVKQELRFAPDMEGWLEVLVNVYVRGTVANDLKRKLGADAAGAAALSAAGDELVKAVYDGLTPGRDE